MHEVAQDAEEYVFLTARLQAAGVIAITEFTKLAQASLACQDSATVEGVEIKRPRTRKAQQKMSRQGHRIQVEADPPSDEQIKGTESSGHASTPNKHTMQEAVVGVVVAVPISIKAQLSIKEVSKLTREGMRVPAPQSRLQKCRIEVEAAPLTISIDLGIHQRTYFDPGLFKIDLL